MRFLGIDYGLRRTGIAIAEVAPDAHAGGGAPSPNQNYTEAETPASQPPPRAMALPFDMFENLPDPQLAVAIANLVKQEHIAQIVIGLPLHADGTVSSQSKLTERFIALLRQYTPIPIHPVTEYLSSHDAEGKLAGHYTRQQKRQRVDALAAARILQDYLDQRGAPGAN